VKHALLALALALTGCSDRDAGGSAALRDVASNARAKYLTHFFYLDGNDLVRTGCGDSLVHDRATCQVPPILRTPAARVFDPEQAALRVSVDTWEKQVDDLRIVIGRNEALIDEQLAGTRGANLDTLRALIATRQQDDTKAAAEVADLDVQLELIRAQLAHGDDVQVRLQLAVTADRRNEAARKRAATAAALAAAREDYIGQAAVAVSGQAFKDLVTQHGEIKAKLAQAETVLAERMAQVAATERVIGLIGRAGVATDMPLESAAFVAEKKVFRSLERAVDKLFPNESREEFKRTVGWLIIDWFGDWTCQGSAGVFAAEELFTLRTTTFDTNRAGGTAVQDFDLFATASFGPAAAPARVFARPMHCTITEAYNVDCEGEVPPGGDLAGRFYVNFFDRGFVSTGLQLRRPNGELVNMLGICGKGSWTAGFDEDG
jgi:hypothetical protein